ncbi:glycerol-3-phosphate dehydrogenase, mitochondrial [Galendromus occidentalis]|uniref:Glycerol-3-phosphate dehydrogenase n=1 Tax=Galendromus occidentalis TaxID=34638 RepID=A0AAJ6QPP3_9ACAR|nr:glycerol-3-phosphate dehydrogenase, mitochondrial [Galendromus occidentalis]
MIGARVIAGAAGVVGAAGALTFFNSDDVHAASSFTRSPPRIVLPTREQQIEVLKKTPEYDVLIIGGGATGAGVAVDSITRGLSTALVEADDFAAGTSSRSTKLIHGGVRYLQKAVFNLDYDQYRMVKEALNERANLLKSAPHLADALPIMLPVYRWWQVPYYWVGIKCYDMVAGRQCLKKSYFLSRKRALELFPMLQEERLCGALVYYDGAHNDSRVCVSLALTAARFGANVANHCRVLSLIKDKSGRVRGAVCQDEFNGQKFEVRAKCVVNATGPFTDNIRKMDDDSVRTICQPSSGVHVVLPSYYSPQNMGLLDPSTSDGRVIFFLPWQGQTIAGTTDKPCKVTHDPAPTEDDIQFILKEIRNYLSPEVHVRRGDVLSAWSGIRPLVLDLSQKAGKTEAIARNHIIELSDSGLVTIAGGKWTTYREMAEQTVDACIKSQNEKITPKYEFSQTEHVLLEGAAGWSPIMYIRLVQDFGLDPEVAQHLASDYGDRAFSVAKLAAFTGKRSPIVGRRLHEEFPYIEAEVRYAVLKEYACTAVDVIARRLRLAFLHVQAAQECLPRIVDIMGEELKWDNKRKKEEIARATEFLNTQMGGAVNKESKEQRSTMSFTKKEVDEYIAKFMIIDRDHKGYITMVDLKRALKESGEAQVTQEQLHEMLNEVDINKNGQIELGEYLELMSNLKSGSVTGSRLAKAVDREYEKHLSVDRSGGGV